MNKQLLFTILFFAALMTKVVIHDMPIFPKGEKAANVYHVGNVWLNELAAPDSVFQYSTSLATFDPGARLSWHQHPGGQILLITAGTGYYQERAIPNKRFAR